MKSLPLRGGPSPNICMIGASAVWLGDLPQPASPAARTNPIATKCAGRMETLGVGWPAVSTTYSPMPRPPKAVRQVTAGSRLDAFDLEPIFLQQGEDAPGPQQMQGTDRDEA